MKHYLKNLFALILIAVFLCAAFPAPKVAEASNRGLVAYWPFNEGTSTQAGDFSGNGNTGTLSGSPLPAWASGKLGKALTFDGTAAIVPVGSGATLDNINTMTISLWINPASNSNGGELYDKISNGSLNAIGPDMWLDSSNVLNFARGFTSVVGQWKLGSALTLGQWQHIVITYDDTSTGNAPVIYVNGVSQTVTQVFAPSGSASDDNAENAVIGAYGATTNTTNFYEGSIDDVRIYNHILSATDVRTLYAAGTSSHLPPNNLGLVGYWPLNEGTSTLADDFSGFNNDLTLSGATIPSWVPGKFGKALSFNGSTGYIAGTPRDITGALTLCAWIYPTSLVDSEVISNKTAGSLLQYNIEVNSAAAGSVALFESNGSAQFNSYITNSSNLFTTNQWTHVCVTRDAGDTVVFAYVNGIQYPTTKTGAFTPVTTAGNVNIGRGGDNTDYFPGSIDDVRIYNRTLSATEINNLYVRGATGINASSATLQNGSTLGTGLVGLWTFDGGDTKWTSATAGFARDRSGNNYNLVFGNMARSTSSVIGVLGQGIAFDGADDFAESATTINYGTSKIATVAFWLNWDAFSDDCTAALVSGNEDTDAGSWFIAPNDCDFPGSFEFVIGDGVLGQSRQESIPRTGARAWHHYVAVLDNSTAAADIIVYKDGVLQTTTVDQANKASAANIGTIKLDVMAFVGGTPPTGKGKLDDVRIYNRALSASEAKQLYQLGAATIKSR